jgi:WD40 repeat protein
MGMGVPICQGKIRLISTSCMNNELICQILEDIIPYSKDTDLTCVAKIVKGVSPADILVLDLSPTLGTMLERCWDLDPSFRPTIKECITIVEAVIPRAESVALPIDSPEPVLPQLSDQSLKLSALDIEEHPEELLTTASPLKSSVPTPTFLPEYTTRQLWDQSTEISSMILSGHKKAILGIAFSPDGSVLASGSEDGTLKIWDMDSRILIKDLGRHMGPINRPAFAPSGTRIAASTSYHGISIWEAASEDLTVFSRDQHWTQAASLPTKGEGYSVAFSSDSLRLAAVGTSKDVQVWDLSSGALLLELEGHTSYVIGVAFSSNGEWLASCSDDQSVRIWNASGSKPLIRSSNRAVVTLNEHTDFVYSVSFSSNGKWLASGSLDGMIQIWNVTSWALLKTLGSEGSGERIFTVGFSSDSARLASGSNNGMLHIWDTSSWTRVMTWKAHIGTIHSVTFSPDGKRLASGSRDKTVRIWQPKLNAS